MTILALETSCDETSAAVLRDACVLSNVVSSQANIHAEYGGVVPEIATRQHIINLPHVIQRALQEAGIACSDVDYFAATRGPGLPSALMAGYRCAQSMAFTLHRPCLGIHHHEAHLYSPWMEDGGRYIDIAGFESSVSLIVSGGHTLLVHVKDWLDHNLLGGTIDDAAGECFDKCAKMLGLPYPGGPVIDTLAAQGNREAFDFPRPKMHDGTDDFSFSGLKTAVRYFIRDHPEIAHSDRLLCDACASIQEAIVEVLVRKTLRAARRLGAGCVTASGGVICNSRLRHVFQMECERAGLRVRMTSPKLSTDNAAMVGITAFLRIKKVGMHGDSLENDILPGWALDDLMPEMQVQ